MMDEDLSRPVDRTSDPSVTRPGPHSEDQADMSEKGRTSIDNTNATGPVDHFGWLDIILAFSRNLKWLILVPLTAGVLAHMASNALPKYYKSTALLRVVGDVEADIRSPIVIDQVLKIFPGPERSVDLRRAWLGDKFTLTRLRGPAGKVGDPTPLLLTVTDEDPETARKITASIIETWLKLMKPAGTDAKSIENQVKLSTLELSSVDAAIKKIEGELGNGQSAETLAALYTLRKTYKKEILEFNARLQGYQPDQVIVSAPTLPDEAIKRIKLAGPIAAMLMLLASAGVVLARAAFHFGHADPGRAAKLSQIKAALEPWRRDA